MKKIGFVWIILLICNISAVKAQVIKIENGVSISSLNESSLGYQGTLTSYQMSVGIDYLDRGWYGLSSSIGYLRKGSKDDILSGLMDGAYTTSKWKHTFDYLTLNTTFRVKGITSDKFTLYAGAGPRIDINLKQKVTVQGEFSYSDSGPDSRAVIPGLKCEIGMDYYFNRFCVGINAGYLPSFTKMIKHTSLKDRTFTAGVVLGYIL